MMASFNRLLLIVLLLFVVFSSYGAERTYRVLFVQSYTAKDIWSQELTEGLEKGFKAHSIQAKITTEYLDSRHWDSEGEEKIMREICRRAEGNGVDLIVVSNDEALYSLLVCGDPLPAKVPVVFFNVEHPNSAVLSQYPNVTGLTVSHSYDKLLETANYIFPHRCNIILITEDSKLSQWSTAEFKKRWDTFVKAHPDYSITELNATTTPLTKIVHYTQLSDSVKNSIVIVPYWGLYMPSIAKVSKSPTFTISNASLTQGGFCSFSPDADQSTYQVTEIIAKMLQGISPSSIEVKNGDSELVFDYKQLLFFGVDKAELPKDSTLINEPYMEKYGVYMGLFYSLIVALLVFLVIRLFLANRRELRRRMHTQTKLLIQNRMVEQRNEFDNVFHSIRDAVVTYDNDLRIHFINRSVLVMLGLPDKTGDPKRPYEGQMAGSICDFVNEGRNVLPELLKKVSVEGVSVELPENTYVYAKDNQRHFLVSGDVVPIYAQGKQTGIVLTFRNISEEALQKRFFNLAVEESSVYPWQFNKETDELIFPAGYLSHMGFDSTHVTRKQLHERIFSEDLEQAVASFDSVVHGQAVTVRFSFRQLNATYNYEWWEFRVSSIKGMTEDEPYSILGVCQSVQRYKNTEEELITARDRALQADKLKTAFLANMSHEIRTPLNAIVGFSDLLRDIDSFSGEEVTQFVSTINKNCELLLALISDILDLSRVESGTMDFQFSSYYLPIIMQEIYDSQRLNMPPGVVLVKDVHERSERTIITDSVRLKQVINNLINNAVKFTTKGSITFGYLDDEPDYTTFFVEDTGIGLTEEDKIRIFERFYKVDSFTQGAGLGLSISQTIVARLRGTITLESQKGKGTRFIVRVPNVVG